MEELRKLLVDADTVAEKVATLRDYFLSQLDPFDMSGMMDDLTVLNEAVDHDKEVLEAYRKALMEAHRGGPSNGPKLNPGEGPLGKLVPCANNDPRKVTACPKAGIQLDAACRLVAYCSQVMLLGR